MQPDRYEKYWGDLFIPEKVRTKDISLAQPWDLMA